LAAVQKLKRATFAAIEGAEIERKTDAVAIATAYGAMRRSSR